MESLLSLRLRLRRRVRTTIPEPAESAARSDRSAPAGEAGIRWQYACSGLFGGTCGGHVESLLGQPMRQVAACPLDSDVRARVVGA